jgi:aminoglycoside phosphotransferase (APT) family kinase protein
MHDDEVDIHVDLVRGLIASQLPQWLDLAIEPVFPRGTDNALYRLGGDKVVRLPRHADSVPGLRTELRWLPRLAHHLPLEVPVPLATGVPEAGFPFEWAVYRWVAGDPATTENIADVHQAALDLARFIGALQRIDAREGPGPGGRGGPLAPREEPLRRSLATLGGNVDAAAVLAVWDDALRAPPWDRPPVWVHGDLDARNVLATTGRICAVVDFGMVATGDPASDVTVAWKMLPAGERATFRRTLAVDEATWRRARGWAISQSLIALGYYTRENNAVLVDEAWRWYRAVLADVET